MKINSYKKGDIVYVYDPTDSSRQGFATFLHDCGIFPGKIGFFTINGKTRNAHYEKMKLAEEFSPLLKALNED